MSLEKRNSIDVNAGLEPELQQALSDFRLSLHAWSEDAFNRERKAAAAAPRSSWRLAAGWALGCALVIGAVSGGVYERHHSRVLALAAQQQQIERQKQAALQKEHEEEALLASVDTDVSQQAPSAMEPLAQLMAEDESK
jgi:uncharacterized protein HemX